MSRIKEKRAVYFTDNAKDKQEDAAQQCVINRLDLIDEVSQIDAANCDGTMVVGLVNKALDCRVFPDLGAVCHAVKGHVGNLDVPSLSCMHQALTNSAAIERAGLKQPVLRAIQVKLGHSKRQRRTEPGMHI